MNDDCKCTPELIDAIVAMMTDPARPRSETYAAYEVEINPRTLRRWREKAALGIEPYATQIPRIDKARNVRRGWLTDEIYAIAEEGTKDDAARLNALKFLAATHYADEYAPTQKLEHSGVDGGAITHEINTDALADRIEALAAGLAVSARPGNATEGDRESLDGGTRGAGSGDDGEE